MPVPGLKPENCARRSAFAARKGFDATPVRLSSVVAAPAEGATLISARGTLPETEAQALGRINAILGRESDPLAADRVHLVYAEAVNGNFIADRFMFLHRSTLKNVAGMAADGFAFMNSHRTGGLSSDAEMPFGRTFAGRYERWAMPGGAAFERSLVGVYMLAGARPNGDSGPGTDDLKAGIDAGTIFDVSIGLYGGDRVCDVCGNDLFAYDEGTGRYLCPHSPGTHRKMGDDEVAVQKGRGVPGGEASYSLVDARPGEVSAVFDGAVPGAGFRKALSLSRRGELGGRDLAEARAAYRPFLSRRSGTFQPKGSAMGLTLNGLLSRLGIKGETEISDLDDDEGHEGPPAFNRGVVLAPAKLSAADDEETRRIRAENDQLKAEKLAREEADRKQADAAIAAQADAFARAEVEAGRATPADSAALSAEYAAALRHDAASGDQGVKLAPRIKALHEARPAHGLTEDAAAGVRLATLPNGEADDDDDAALRERVRANMSSVKPRASRA